MPSARQRLPGWRQPRIAAIEARCASRLGDDRAYLAYLGRHFGASSLNEHDDAQLDRTYRDVIRKRV